MTVVLVVVAGAVYAVCLTAARRIGAAKGVDAKPWPVAALLFAPGAVAGAAFMRPADPEQDRLDWWGESSVARAWTVVAALAVAAAVAVGVYAVTRPATLDGANLELQIEGWLAKQGAAGATVNCPGTYPAKAGYTFLCSVTGSTKAAEVEVAVLNGKGDVTWQVIG